MDRNPVISLFLHTDDWYVYLNRQVIRPEDFITRQIMYNTMSKIKLWKNNTKLISAVDD